MLFASFGFVPKLPFIRHEAASAPIAKRLVGKIGATGEALSSFEIWSSSETDDLTILQYQNLNYKPQCTAELGGNSHRLYKKMPRHIV